MIKFSPTNAINREEGRKAGRLEGRKEGKKAGLKEGSLAEVWKEGRQA